MGAGLRRQAAIALGVWAIAFFVLAAAYALPGGPQAALTADSLNPYAGETVRFDASGSVAHDSGNGRIVGYNFSFGDGATTGWQSGDLASHAYAQVGIVNAVVTVIDARGMSGQASVTLQVRPLPPPTGDVPDLVPVRVSFTPPEPEVNSSVNVSVTLVNRGGVTAQSATIHVTDTRPDGLSQYIEGFPIAHAVDAGAAATFAGPSFRLAQAGNHTLTFVVANVTPAEPDPRDNVLTATVVVLPARAPATSGATSVPVSPLAVGLIGAGIVATIATLLFVLRPRPPGPLQPPPPEPKDRSPPPIWPP